MWWIYYDEETETVKTKGRTLDGEKRWIQGKKKFPDEYRVEEVLRKGLTQTLFRKGLQIHKGKMKSDPRTLVISVRTVN